MEIPISKLSLMNGDDFKLYSHNGTDYYIRNPKLLDIVELDKIEPGKYFEYLFILSSTVNDVADVLWCETQTWYEDLDDWAFFIQRNITTEQNKLSNIYTIDYAGKDQIKIYLDCILMSDNFNDAMNYFFNTTGKYVIINKERDGNYDNFITINVHEASNNCYVYNTNNLKLSKHTYNIMIEYLSKLHWIKRDYDFLHGGTKKAKKYILQNDYKTRKKNKKPKVDLSSIVSSLIAKGQRKEEVFNMSIYLIYELFYRYYRIENYDNTMTALYTGNIDTKKHPVNFDKIDWSNIIY